MRYFGSDNYRHNILDFGIAESEVILMANKKVGKQSIVFESKPYIIGRGTVVGQKEGQGPLGKEFDIVLEDDMYGQKSWEKAESKMLKEAMYKAISRGGINEKDIDVMLCGDLINQLMSSSFAARDMHIPFLGVYGACSTMTESLLVGSMLVDGGFANHVLAGASSHFCTAERQFRTPVEHGNQRPPSAQWTATAAGAALIASPVALPKGLTGKPKMVRVEAATIGKVLDAGIKDANQMGAAMTPSAVDTLLNHLEDLCRPLEFYDLIATGDLGFIGKNIMIDLLAGAGINKKEIIAHYDDCGTMLFGNNQDVHSGGSGCGCSASVFCGHLLRLMEAGKLKRLLLMSTGALISTISPFQGESIPGITHAVSLEVE